MAWIWTTFLAKDEFVCPDQYEPSLSSGIWVDFEPIEDKWNPKHYFASCSKSCK